MTGKCCEAQLYISAYFGKYYIRETHVLAYADAQTREWAPESTGPFFCVRYGICRESMFYYVVTY